MRSILKYAKRLIHIDLCPVAIHRFQKSANKKKRQAHKKEHCPYYSWGPEIDPSGAMSQL